MSLPSILAINVKLLFTIKFLGLSILIIPEILNFLFSYLSIIELSKINKSGLDDNKLLNLLSIFWRSFILIFAIGLIPTNKILPLETKLKEG